MEFVFDGTDVGKHKKSPWCVILFQNYLVAVSISSTWGDQIVAREKNFWYKLCMHQRIWSSFIINILTCTGVYDRYSLSDSLQKLATVSEFSQLSPRLFCFTIRLFHKSRWTTFAYLVYAYVVTCRPIYMDEWCVTGPKVFILWKDLCFIRAIH